MKRSILLYLLFGLLFTLACREEEKPAARPRLFADFFVRYLEEEGQIKAHASFAEGDSLKTALPKTFQGGVAFLGSGMQPRQLSDNSVRYVYNASTSGGSFPGSFPFRFKDDEGKQQEFALRMAPVEDFSINGDISKSKGMNLTVKGELLSADESFVLLFSDEENRASTITIAGPSNSMEHYFPPENLINLRPGKGRLYLVRKKTEIREESNRRVVSNTEFYSRTIDIEVKE
jgi:hypothetical protein